MGSKIQWPLITMSTQELLFDTPEAVQSPLTDSALLPVTDIAPTTTPAPEEQATSNEVLRATVRSATEADLDDLVRIELTAFRDVYGATPDEETVTGVYDKYRQRIAMLGEWVRVMEHPEQGIFGMLVGCRTNLDRDDFVGRDMTENTSIESAHDPNGKNGYVINLAVLPNDGKGNRFDLFGDAISKAVEVGVERVYFESRLPGFQKWLRGQVGEEGYLRLTEGEKDVYAEKYWRTTKDFGDGSGPQPIDKLLRLYTNFGAEPITLVKDAWHQDTPSKAYGVLCELQLSSSAPTEEEVSAPVQQETVPLPAIDLEPRSNMLSFAGNAIARAVRSKKALMLATAAGVIGYEEATGSFGQLVQNVSENAAWVGTAYGASHVAYAAGAAIMLAGAGAASRNPFKFKQFLPQIAERIRDNNIVRTGFWLNRVSALGAAAVVSTGVVETLPTQAWYALALPALDVLSTVAIGRALYGRKDQPELQHTQPWGRHQVDGRMPGVRMPWSRATGRHRA